MTHPIETLVLACWLLFACGFGYCVFMVLA